MIGAWAERIRATLRLLPVLLAPECRHVEVVVRAADLLGAAAVGRVGMKDAVAIGQEHAGAVDLAGRGRHPSPASLRPNDGCRPGLRRKRRRRRRSRS